MNLNELELTPFLLQELYRESLVDTAEAKPSIPAAKNIPAEVHVENQWKSLGENRKLITLIVSYPDSIYMPDNSFQFLLGILGACKFSMDDVVLINMALHAGTRYTEVLKEFKSRNLFLFGIDPLSFGLPINFPQFQAQPFSKCTFLYAPTLEELNEDKVLKSKLWVCLKRIFAL